MAGDPMQRPAASSRTAAGRDTRERILDAAAAELADGRDGLRGDRPEPAPTRDRILDAAARLLGRPGSPIALDAIGTEAGLTKGALYHHFRDRRHLLAALAERISPVAAIAAALERSEPRAGRVSLANALAAYSRAVTAHRRVVR